MESPLHSNGHGGFGRRLRETGWSRGQNCALGRPCCWADPCTVAPQRIDPLEQLGIEPEQPLPYWGWGAIPDQYGRDWDGDDGETPLPPDPELADLPPLQPGWGPRPAPPRPR
ncbi:hypothetical protein ACFXPA_41560 [Amycolatopsis sp. NPDC059090]|uniref:hypothetical protein n=1 Tax=Amycolatopsis sp. NPDC059090 TaxID=3346723 RepID=UPI003672308C